MHAARPFARLAAILAALWLALALPLLLPAQARIDVTVVHPPRDTIPDPLPDTAGVAGLIARHPDAKAFLAQYDSATPRAACVARWRKVGPILALDSLAPRGPLPHVCGGAPILLQWARCAVPPGLLDTLAGDDAPPWIVVQCGETAFGIYWRRAPGQSTP